MSKRVLITGGTEGIGLELVKRYTELGDEVFVVARTLSGIDKVKEKYNCHGKCADISIEGSEIDISNWISYKIPGGMIDILINNAGVISWEELSRQHNSTITSQLRTNLEGLIRLTKQILPKIRETIINVGSGAGTKGHKDLTVYCASKFGVVGFTEALAQEITTPKVYCISPMQVRTKMTNYKGLDPKGVAEFIQRASYGEIKLKHGSNFDMNESYQSDREMSNQTYERDTKEILARRK